METNKEYLLSNCSGDPCAWVHEFLVRVPWASCVDVFKSDQKKQCCHLPSLHDTVPAEYPPLSSPCDNSSPSSRIKHFFSGVCLRCSTKSFRKHKDGVDVGGDANKYIKEEISCICVFICSFCLSNYRRLMCRKW